MDRTQLSRSIFICSLCGVFSRNLKRFAWGFSFFAVVRFASPLLAGANSMILPRFMWISILQPLPGSGLSSAAENKAEALAYFTVGRMQENSDRADDAIASYLKVLELQPDQLELARKCAYLLASRSGKQETARELLESTLQRNSGVPFPYIMLSEFLSTYHSNNQDHKDRALALAVQAVEMFPGDAMTYEHLAKMYLLGKRNVDAQNLLKDALKKTNSDPEFWIRLGKVATRVWPIQSRGGGK